LKTQKKWKNEWKTKKKFEKFEKRKNVLAFQNRENWKKKRQKNPIFFLLLAKFLKKQKIKRKQKVEFFYIYIYIIKIFKKEKKRKLLLQFKK
jgi:hypothetical protein